MAAGATEAEIGGADAELRRPRIKPEHRAYRTVDGNVRIGSVIYGIGAEIIDPDGWIWTLTQLMDGTRSGSRIAAEVAALHPAAVRPETVEAAIGELRQAGYVEDAAAPLPPGLAERDRLRHTRGVALLRWMDLSPRASPWHAQLRLRRARVLVLGVGGTGGAAAQILTAAGVGRLHVVDPDTVELSNLNRQLLYGEADIGNPKADAAVAALRGLNSDAAVTGERREIRGQDALAALIAEGPPYDVLVLGADRPPEIRRWANRVCLAANLPWVEGGYRGPLVTAGVHVPGCGPCWECQRAGESERRDLRLPPGQDETAASPRMPWNPASAVTATLSGTLVAHAALALLTGVPPMRPGFRYGINLMSLGDPVLQRHPRRPGCPACGDPAA
ncbi:ThiF family adenylyltransferase [Actinacidiphila paucisporea]|uniref:Molybdopterin or thiamine biosynthesis adenylyltransferase n=1 Tax=Actinacidiphila paucisporea TaxID=310782 RepID=A0A1M7PBD4_9ACTN|nr:Molybdopterin or thiamine biosynthesis adenylyltransferase [Actinacidiphila paucisporea]